jgi:hypothetical protein
MRYPKLDARNIAIYRIGARAEEAADEAVAMICNTVITRS